MEIKKAAPFLLGPKLFVLLLLLVWFCLLATAATASELIFSSLVMFIRPLPCLYSYSLIPYHVEPCCTSGSSVVSWSLMRSGWEERERLSISADQTCVQKHSSSILIWKMNLHIIPLLCSLLCQPTTQWKRVQDPKQVTKTVKTIMFTLSFITLSMQLSLTGNHRCNYFCFCRHR